MPIIVITCPTEADANTAKSQAATGTLWGISLGTTTTVETKEATLGVQATETRCVNLLAAAPSDWMAWAGAVHLDAPWDDLPQEMQSTYFLGKMDV